MPYCKYCKKEISKFDSDVCPHCGGISPIEDNYKTMDVTTSFGKYGKDISLYKSKSHKKFALLCMLLGMIGVHNFYIHKQKTAYINIAVSILFIACLGLILYFSGAIKNYYLAFLLPFIILFVIYLFLGLYYLKKDSLKDGEGEFLR